MRYSRAIPAIVAGVMLSTASLALAANQATVEQPKPAATQMRAMSAAAAVAAIADSTKGKVLDLKYEVRQGKAEYRAHILRDGMVMKVHLNPLTGKVSTPSAVDAALAAKLRDEKSAAVLAMADTQSFQQAIEKAERQGAGQVVEARLIAHNGHASYQIKLDPKDPKD
jgi:uncharacterized membrane protein YkoI